MKKIQVQLLHLCYFVYAGIISLCNACDVNTLADVGV